MNMTLDSIYKKLYKNFGPQYWWPAETPFEVMVGAILTQNTSWSNVERAINNLKKEKLLEPNRLHKLPQKKLSNLIIPAGYYNIKAKRLREFLDFLFKNYKGNLKKMFSMDALILRRQLLSVNGIGPETADSILLYAGNKPVFVIDTYTRRIIDRMGLRPDGNTYSAHQSLFMSNLPPDARLFNEYHALLVRHAKEVCRTKPICGKCCLNDTTAGHSSGRFPCASIKH